MFYYLIPSFLTYNLFLVAAAIIPALFLMGKVYRSDRLEPESPHLLFALARAGVFAALIAILAERVLGAILDAVVRDPALHEILLYFGVVAISEEGAKYLLLRRRTWRSPEFNCQYDGLVYAVFVSLGFALWENISYVLHYGFSTAVVRALTAIPGHSCFGVFMGVFYGLARRAENGGHPGISRRYRTLAILVPAVLHGAYDYIASEDASIWLFVAFIVALFLLSYRLVSRMSRQDRYIA